MSPVSTWMGDSLRHWWLLRCDWHLLCSAMAYVIWAYKRFPQCSPTCKKAGVCTVMPMWLVHIKEHVDHQNMPTPILLSAMSECVNGCCIKRPNKKEVLLHMRWQTCMLPRELIWEEVAPPHEKWNNTVCKK